MRWPSAWFAIRAEFLRAHSLWPPFAPRRSRVLERRKAIELALHPVVLDRHVLALDVAGFVEAFAERSDIAYGVLGRPAIDEADYWRWLLRARRERQGHRRAADERDEVAPSYV